MPNDLSVGFDRERRAPDEIGEVIEACLSEPKITAMMRRFAKSMKFVQYRPAKAAHEIEAAEGAMTKFLITGSEKFAGDHVDAMLPQVEEFADLVHQIRGSQFYEALVHATAAQVGDKFPGELRERVFYVTSERLLDKCIGAVYAADNSRPTDILKQCQFTFCYIPGLDDATTLEETMTSHWTDESGCLTIKPDKVFASFLQMAGITKADWLAGVEDNYAVRLDEEVKDGTDWVMERSRAWSAFEDLPTTTPPVTDVASIVEAVDNTPMGFTPCIAFTADALKMLKRDWDQSLSVKGGVLGLTDFVNGSGDPIRFNGTAVVSGKREDCVLSVNMPNSLVEGFGIPAAAFKSVVKDAIAAEPRTGAEVSKSFSL